MTEPDWNQTLNGATGNTSQDRKQKKREMISSLLEWIDSRWPFQTGLEDEEPFWQRELRDVQDTDFDDLRQAIVANHKWKRAPSLANVVEWWRGEFGKRTTRTQLGGRDINWLFWEDFEGQLAWAEEKKAELNPPPFCLECKKIAWLCYKTRQCPADSQRKFVVTQGYLDALERRALEKTKKDAARLVKDAAETMRTEDGE